MKTIRMLFRIAVYLLSTPAPTSFGPYLQDL